MRVELAVALAGEHLLGDHEALALERGDRGLLVGEEEVLIAVREPERILAAQRGVRGVPAVRARRRVAAAHHREHAGGTCRPGAGSTRR